MTGCSAFNPSKVARGESYASGDARYDGYFESVYREQQAKKKWGDERKATREPLRKALLAPFNSSDNYLVSSTRTRAQKSGASAGLDLAGPRVLHEGNGGDAALYGGVEQ